MKMICRTSFFAAPMIAILFFSAAITPSYAIKGDTSRFNICKQLKAQGKVNWYGIATGTQNDTFSLFKYDRTFHTKACFSTKSACKTWVKRIWWEIPTMDELHNAWCQKL